MKPLGPRKVIFWTRVFRMSTNKGFLKFPSGVGTASSNRYNKLIKHDTYETVPDN